MGMSLVRSRLLLTPLLLSTLTTALYSSSDRHVIQLTTSSFATEVLDSPETWLVEFYAPWCGHCRNLAPAWSAAAEKLHPYVKVGAVDCDAQQGLAQKFGVTGFPTIKVFKGAGRKERAKPDDYRGDRSAKAITDYGKAQMVSYAARVKAKGMDAYFGDEKELPHVLLFTDKAATSPLFKSLSARYYKKVALGEMKKAEVGKEGIAKKYAITSYPTLLAFPPGLSDPADASRLEGEMTPDSIEEFIASYAIGGKNDDAAAKASEKVFAQPKAHAAGVEVIASLDDFEKKCAARADGLSCCLTAVPGGEKHAVYPALSPIAEKYKFDKFAFAVLDTTVGSDLALALGFNLKLGGFGVMRGKKRKMGLLEVTPELALSEERIVSFLDKALGGDVRYQPITDSLPAWEAAASEADAEAESVANEGSCAAPADGDEGTCNAP